jgi:hypothetical protein
MNEKLIIGTWILERFELKNLSLNKTHYLYGQNPIGILIFSSDGYMSVTIMSDNRKNFAVESLLGASLEEKANAAETYLSYSGRWRIDKDKIFVTVLVSLLPNLKNKEHFRTFQITNENLLLRTPIITQEESKILIELSWQKLNLLCGITV